MKYSNVAAALAVTAASSGALAPQSFTQRVGRQSASSSKLFYQDDNGGLKESGDMLKKVEPVLSAEKKVESERELQPKEFEKVVGLEKNIERMVHLGLHIVNPFRKEPLSERQKLIKDNVVDPIAKLSGGCALIGATGVFAAMGAVKLTADALNQNFPETFGYKDQIEQVKKKSAAQNEARPDSFANKVGKDYLSRLQDSSESSIYRRPLHKSLKGLFNVYCVCF